SPAAAGRAVAVRVVRPRSLPRPLAGPVASLPAGVRASPQRGRELLEAASIGARGAARGLLDEPRADAQLLLHLLSGRETLLEIVPPRLEVVHPGDRADQVATELLGDERAGPAVVALRLHRDLVPLLLVLVPVQEGCAQLVVTVAERVHADGDAIAAD